MKLSLKWLADYVALPGSVDELAKRLTMAGLEIEGISRPGDALRGIVVAQILASDKHPNAAIRIKSFFIDIPKNESFGRSAP